MRVDAKGTMKKAFVVFVHKERVGRGDRGTLQRGFSKIREGESPLPRADRRHSWKGFK